MLFVIQFKSVKQKVIHNYYYISYDLTILIWDGNWDEYVDKKPVKYFSELMTN